MTDSTAVALDASAIETLKGVTTATLTTILLKKGLRNVWMRGAMPLRSDQERVVGPAFTFRFVPAREDLATPASWSSPISTRAAIEAMPEGAFAVIDAMGVSDAGVFGDILCARMVKRKAVGMVTDGVVRDLEGVLGAGLPVWCRGAAAPPSVAGLTFVGWEETVGCGGVCVIPGDTIVAEHANQSRPLLLDELTRRDPTRPPRGARAQVQRQKQQCDWTTEPRWHGEILRQ